MQSIYYKNLGADQKYYDYALQGLKNRARTFQVGDPRKTTEIVMQVLCDCPELFYVGQEVRVMGGLFKMEALPVYIYSQAEISQLNSQLEAKARELIGELINDHQSDYDKVRALHDYLKSNLEYDTVAASSRSMTDRNVADAHTIVGALLKHKCVCEGFAKAMKYLCDKISLECYVVCGKGNSPLAMGPHAWNIVRINGYYHHVDVTWDNQYSDSAEIPNYGYLNLSDEEIAKDHTWDRRFYPTCPSSPYNYFRVNDALLDSRAQLESFLYNSFQNEEEFVMFRVVRGSILEREINGCLPDCIQRASDRCKYIRASSFQYGCVPEQLTFFVRLNYEYQ